MAPVFNARLFADVHMAGDRRRAGGGNAFAIIGELDIEIEPTDEDRLKKTGRGLGFTRVGTGEVRGVETGGIAF